MVIATLAFWRADSFIYYEPSHVLFWFVLKGSLSQMFPSKINQTVRQSENQHHAGRSRSASNYCPLLFLFYAGKQESHCKSYTAYSISSIDGFLAGCYMMIYQKKVVRLSACNKKGVRIYLHLVFFMKFTRLPWIASGKI